MLESPTTEILILPRDREATACTRHNFEKRERERKTQKTVFLRVWACSACLASLAGSRLGLEHGRRRRQSDECGSAKHGRHARYGLTSARTAAAKASAVVELSSREATQRVQGVRRRQRCCEHGWSRSQWKEGGGSGICEYGRRRNGCRECGGSASICEHVRHRMVCKEHAAAAASRCRLRAHCEHAAGSTACARSAATKMALASWDLGSSLGATVYV